MSDGPRTCWPTVRSPRPTSAAPMVIPWNGASGSKQRRLQEVRSAIANSSNREGHPMPRWQSTKGLHDLGNDCFAYLQPDGSWGWSNAGLVRDGDQTLLVDTLFDLPLTAAMLKTMRDAVPAARNIRKLVNTHANGDHTFGNQLVEGAEIIACRACAEEYAEAPPEP